MTNRPQFYALILAASLTTTLALAAVPDVTDAQPNLRGRWSSKNSTGACWGIVGAYGYCNGSEPVHMILTRNTVGGHHSQLLWYEGHQNAGGTWEGGLWGWDPATTTAGQNCSGYPQASFSSLSFGNPGYNIFCSGHSVLADGRVLLSGGTIGGEGGDKRSILFNPASNTWALQDTMELWRWYPTNTALPNGKVLVSSGSMYVDLLQFGGRTTPTGTTLHGDSLEKLALVPSPFWEVPAAKRQGYESLGWPASREGHSATWIEGDGIVDSLRGAGRRRHRAPARYLVHVPELRQRSLRDLQRGAVRQCG